MVSAGVEAEVEKDSEVIELAGNVVTRGAAGRGGALLEEVEAGWRGRREGARSPPREIMGSEDAVDGVGVGSAGCLLFLDARSFERAAFAASLLSFALLLSSENMGRGGGSNTRLIET